MVTAVDAAGGGGSSSSSGSGDKTGALQQAEQVNVWGVFYIKPNFPGRCSHVCNGGFITDPRRRRRGVAKLMGHAFLRLARDLGYKASYFNLVSAGRTGWEGAGRQKYDSAGHDTSMSEKTEAKTALSSLRIRASGYLVFVTAVVSL